jgi:hypothetical protein
MEVIARIVERKKRLRLFRIAGHPVKIDHGVVCLACSNPLVERLALCFSDLGVIGSAVEWRQRGSINLQPMRVRLLDQLLMARDEVFRALPMSLIPSSTTTCVTPGCDNAWRSKRAKALTP